jgi:hypothetical protein
MMQSGALAQLRRRYARRMTRDDDRLSIEELRQLVEQDPRGTWVEPAEGASQHDHLRSGASCGDERTRRA